MAVEAYVHHHLPGRLRIRVPAAKGEETLLRELGSAIARAPGVDQVEYNPVTGSILITYSPAEHHSLDSLHDSLKASAVPITVKRLKPAGSHARRRHSGRSAAATKIDSFFSQLDNEIRNATDNEIDLKFILPFAVGVLGILSLRRTAATPLWLTLLIFAFHSFLGLHNPAGDVSAAESLAMTLQEEEFWAGVKEFWAIASRGGGRLGNSMTTYYAAQEAVGIASAPVAALLMGVFRRIDQVLLAALGAAVSAIAPVRSHFPLAAVGS
jgi:hypothetical protein